MDYYVIQDGYRSGPYPSIDRAEEFIRDSLTDGLMDEAGKKLWYGWNTVASYTDGINGTISIVTSK